MTDVSPVKRALATIDALQRKLQAVEAARHEPVAIIGMGCRLPPDLDTPDDYWSLLASGRSAVADVPPGRWPADALHDPDATAPGRMVTRRGSFLRDVAGFDAAYFGFAPAEARAMDPQQRLLLEVAWEALADAGLPEEKLAGSATGVFIGAASSDYRELLHADRAGIDPYCGTGTSNSVLSGRIAYMLDLRGPAVTIDTACSSSLVAVHMACQSLRNGECDAAIAGGVHVMAAPEPMIASSKMGLLSPDGLCRTFDAAADGVGIGEGCGAVVLKRLSDALAAGDPIVALVRGSAINQDGRSNGLTAPNGTAQVAVIRRALSAAGVEPASIGFVETHGTGTPLGDPIEVEALTEALGRDGPSCWLGSGKTNFGHLTAAAGIAGLLKAALALERGVVPPNLHFSALNPHIALERTRFALPAAIEAWPRIDGPRRAGVSSFGWSGTNCHVVLEQAPARIDAQGTAGEHVLLVSARDPAALQAVAERYRVFVSVGGNGRSLALGDICWTAAARRTHQRHRLAVRGRTHDEIAAALARPPQQMTFDGPVGAYLAGGPVDVAALFPSGGRCVRLPRYAWQHRPYWLPAQTADRVAANGAAPAAERGALIVLLESRPQFLRYDTLVAFLCREVAAVLGFEEGQAVDPQEGFFQLGMTSVGAVALHRRLEAACDQRWPIATVFENRRVGDLAEFLRDGALRRLFAADVKEPEEPDDELFAKLRSTLDRLEPVKPE